MRKHYREKHDFLLEQLRGLERSFVLSGENAGLHVLLKSRRGVPERELVQAAYRERIKVYGLSDSLTEDTDEKEEQGTVLLGYGALTKEEIREGVERLKRAWGNLLY